MAQPRLAARARAWVPGEGQGEGVGDGVGDGDGDDSAAGSALRVGFMHEKTTPPMTTGRQSHLAREGDLPYMIVLTSAEKTGSPALTIWPNVTEPACPDTHHAPHMSRAPRKVAPQSLGRVA